LDVLARTHNYESIVSYTFEGFSKHYNTENRLGIHSHTNTKYRGVTNFRYWMNSLKAVSVFDFDTLLEMTTFVQYENYTYGKRKSDDFDDRVMSMVWGLFILDNTIATKYYTIIDTDDQGKPLKIKPFSDNSDLIKKSPLRMGNVTNFKKTATTNATFSFVGKFDTESPVTYAQDQAELTNWLINWGSKPKETNVKIEEKPNEEYRPIVIF
jgi:hypothetical protein